MIRLKTSLALAMSFGLAAEPVLAGGVGTTAVPFLKIPVSARAAALGGSFAGVWGDAGVLEYNPAGLAGVERGDIQATYVDYFDTTYLQSLAAAFPFRLNVRKNQPEPSDARFSPDTIFVGFQYRAFRSQDERRSDIGIKLGSFADRDQLLQGSLAYAIGPRLSIGASGKFIDSKLEDESAKATAGDLGVLSRVTDRLALGASIGNVGGDLKFTDKADPLPAAARAGLSYNRSRALFVADVTAWRDQVVRPSAGLEWKLNDSVRIRGGVFHQTTFGASAGLGLQFFGPSKVVPGRNTRPAAPASAAAGSEVQEKAAQVALALTEQYRALDLKEPTPVVAVFPFTGETARIGAIFSDAVRKALEKNQQMAVLDQTEVLNALDQQQDRSASIRPSDSAVRAGRTLDADYGVTGSIQRNDGHFTVEAKLVELKQGRTVANTYADLPTDAFSTTALSSGGGRHRLSQGSARSASDNERADDPPRFANVNFGLDYAFTTDSDLGFVHRVLFRILY